MIVLPSMVVLLTSMLPVLFVDPAME